MPEPQPSPVEEQEVITHAFENGEQIIAADNPWELLEHSKVVTEREAPALLIRAINAFIHQGQNFTAQSVVEILMDYSLTLDEGFSLQIIHAQLAEAASEYARAIKLLSVLDYNQIQNIETKKQALSILANAQIALGHPFDATAALLDIDLLTGDVAGNAEQLENQQKILQLLRTMDALQVSLLRENLFNPHLDGWLALANTMETTTRTYIDVDLEHWRLAYPDHPVQSQLLAQYAGRGERDEYRQIALLLPLTSPYGTVAGAFYDGFMQAHSNNISLNPPLVVLYDVGEEPYLSSFYYQAAVNEGADFVVGPLGRQAADALLSSRQPEITTLLIAEVPPESRADNLFGISLSPEKEARQIADKAFADGRRQATVFRSQSKWGERVANAFVSQWELLGGTVVKNKSFPNDISDYTRIIQKFLGLDKSIARARLLEAQIDTNLKFAPRRNDDMDMLFLAANADQARLVVPQLRFFQAHNLPIYATSYVYSGNPNPALDADLDGLIFGDMKWMLEGVSRYKLKVAEKRALKSALKTAPKVKHEETSTAEHGDRNVNVNETAFVQGNSGSLTTTNPVRDKISDLNNPEHEAQESANKTRNPYQNSTLNRLYALGIQSYQLIPRLNLLRSKNLERFFGRAMAVSVDQDGSVVRHPAWAKFVSGLAEPIDPLAQQQP
ncbi:penicillin-binding protein activator [Candidatus Spongiihabitans sp.]|uniref:penicillin-binding protein activator n=1 Tax=Candidatus Spongiihabitans sp. TaxID=3101308 RepID=UPI003C6F7C82